MDTPFNVLSLEDSDLDFEIISEQLIKAGYNLNISRAETENEFTSLICNNNYDIILADYNLPQFNAFEALKICNVHCPEVPFICVSGSIGEIMAIELLKMGAVDYVIKDRLERLPFAVKRALEDAKEKNNRKKIEEALRESEEKLNYAQEVAKMGSWDFDVAKNKYYWSKNMYQMLCFKPFDFEPTYELFLTRVHPGDKNLIEAFRNKIISTKEPESYDFRYLLPGDKIIWVQNIITPVFKDGNLMEMHGVNIDITDKKIAEQELIKAKENAEASDRLKTAFINNISHEIRTPLNGILGFGQMLTDTEFSNEEKVEYFKMLNESSERLLNTMTNILDISLLKSGNQKVFRQEIHLEDLIFDISQKFHESCKRKNLNISIRNTHLGTNPIIFTDRDLLAKILYQLIDNAVKFTAYGTIVIGFEKTDTEYRLYVQDSGIGISEESKNKIFDNFTQEDIADTRKYEGSGIGLAIAKGYVELLEGEMWLDSEKEKGSTFYFTLPF